jgi:hypothetical protein
LQQQVSFGFQHVDVEEVLTVSSLLFNTFTIILATPVFQEGQIVGVVMVLQECHVEGALEGLNLIVQHIGSSDDTTQTASTADWAEMIRVVSSSRTHRFPLGVFSVRGYLEWFSTQLDLSSESLTRLDVVSSLLPCIETLMSTPSLQENAVLSPNDWGLIHRYHRAVRKGSVDVRDVELQVLMAIEILCDVEAVEVENERVKMFHQNASSVLADSLLQKILGDFSSLTRIRDAHTTANDDTAIRGI